MSGEWNNETYGTDELIPQVLALVPPEWPLDVVSSFFKRSLRRQLHDKATGEILKAISAGQNMEVHQLLYPPCSRSD